MSISMSTSCVRYPSTISGAWLKAAPFGAWDINTAGDADGQLSKDGFCCTPAFFASSESESPGVRVRGGCCALNGFGAVWPLLKLGWKDSFLDVGDVRKGSDCNRFYGGH